MNYGTGHDLVKMLLRPNEVLDVVLSGETNLRCHIIRDGNCRWALVCKNRDKQLLIMWLAVNRRPGDFCTKVEGSWSWSEMGTKGSRYLNREMYLCFSGVQWGAMKQVSREWWSFEVEFSCSEVKQYESKHWVDEPLIVGA